MQRTPSGTTLRFGAAAMLVAALAACMPGPRDMVPIRRSGYLAPDSPALPVPAAVEPSDLSKAVARHFARLETDLRSRGLMRLDGGGPDTPWGARELTENFVRIALYDEYVQDGGRLVARETPARLRRWQGPIRIGLRFGPSVPEAQRSQDRATVTAYAQQLAQHTGLSIRVSDQSPNYWVYVVSEDERPGLGPEWARLFPGVTLDEMSGVTGMSLSTVCMVMAISDGPGPVYSGALAVIRSELPDRLRLSCFHEELAQGLGLANDHPRARPSIFNDDEEFATLTGLDAAMLQVLYDPRLRPGMREPEVRATLGPIIAGLTGGGS